MGEQGLRVAAAGCCRLLGPCITKVAAGCTFIAQSRACLWCVLDSTRAASCHDPVLLRVHGQDVEA